MAQNVGDWSIKTSVNAAGFTSGMDKMARDAKQTEGVIGTAMKSIQGHIGAIATIAGISAGVYGLLKLESAIKGYVTAGMDAIKMQERMSQQLGVLPSQAAALSAIGGQAGMSPADVLSSSTQALRHIGELRRDLATGGTGGAAGSSLRALGIDPTAFANMSSWSDQLGLLSDRLRTVANAGDRAEISRAILGRGYQELMPILRAGSAGIQRYSELAERFGVTVGRDAADAITGVTSAARDYNTVQRLASEGLRNQFTVGFQEATVSARNYAAATNELIRLQPEMAKAMKEAGGTLGAILGGVESLAVKVLAGMSRIAEVARNLVGMRPPGEVSGNRNDTLEMHRSNIRDAERLANEFTAQINAGSEDVTLVQRRQEQWRRIAENQVAIDNIQGSVAAPPASAVAAINANLFSGPAIQGIQAWEQEAQQAGHATLNAIAESTGALERQNQVWGMSTEEIQRRAFVLQGASDQELAAFDAAAQAMERNRQLQQQQAAAAAAQSPLQRMQNDLANLIGERQFQGIAQGDFRNRLGRILGGAMGGGGETPLLGSLSSGGADAAAVIQASMVPQVDRLAQLNATLEAMQQTETEQRDFMERVAQALENGELRIRGFGN